MDFEGGPWGIVIVISAFMIQVFVSGVSGVIGVYNIEFLDYFKASASEVSVVASLNCGVFMGSGPIVSFLMTKFSYRKIVLGGTVLVVLGLLAVPVFPNLYVMYLTVGVLFGFGGCCTYIPSHTLSGLYYDKYRSLATGVATSGSGLGLALMPILVGIFIEKYTWQGSFIMLAGLCLHNFVFGALLRSPPVLIKNSEEEVVGDSLLQHEDEDDAGETLKEHTNVQNGVCTDVSNSAAADGSQEVNGSNNLLESTKSDILQIEAEIEAESKEVNRKDLPDSARHIYIFKNYNFVVYFMNNYFWNNTVLMLGAFLPEYFRIRGFSMMEISWLVGASGLGTCLGGILGGVLGNIKGINRTYLYIFVSFIAGIIILLLPLGQSIGYFAFLQFVCGLSLGVILGLLVVVLADLIGIRSLGNGMGYLMLSNGLGTFTGPIIAGILIDTTGSYESTIYLAGSFMIVSGVTMCLIPLRQKLRGHKSKLATLSN